MIEHYSRAKRYAYKLLDGQDYLDLVHDAFLQYYTNRRRNLFDEPIWLVMKIMRDAGVDRKRKKEAWGKYKYQHRQVLDGDLVSGDPFEAIAATQQLELITANILPHDGVILKLKIEGYTSKEISERVNFCRTGVDYRLSKIKNTARKLWI